MNRTISSKFVRFAAVAVVVVCTPMASLAERVALVIGNSAYENASPLANPRKDAEAIASKLRTLGFETVEGYDLGVRDMGEKIRDFARASRDAELSVVFYAGHGMAVNGENYLVPIDAVMEDKTALNWELIPMSLITDQFDSENGAHLLFLDACRDNPLAGKLAAATGNGTRSAASQGLAMIEVPNSGTGTGIAFSTAPGAVAQDGKGNHSPFTEALLAHMGTANLPVSSMMNKVNADVRDATGDTQKPWFNASFTDDIYLNRLATPEPAVMAQAPSTAPVMAAPAPQSNMLAFQAMEDEKQYWEFAQSSNDTASYQLYLDRYPSGRFAPMARLAMDRLKKQDVQQQQPAQLAYNPTQQAGSPYPQAQTRAFSPTAPLVLTPTPYMRALPANQQTEGILQIGSTQFRDANKIVQARLTAAGYDVGSIDGVIGNGTRSKVRAWQSANGLTPSGYFNALQLQLLYAQSESTYAQVLARASSRVTTSSRSSSSSRRSSSGGVDKFVGDTVKSFAHGLGMGFGSR